MVDHVDDAVLAAAQSFAKTLNETGSADCGNIISVFLQTLIDKGPDERMEVVASDMDLKRWDLSAGWLLALLVSRLTAIGKGEG